MTSPPDLLCQHSRHRGSNALDRICIALVLIALWVWPIAGCYLLSGYLQGPA